MRNLHRLFVVGLVFGVALAVKPALSDQPKLGFSGTLVQMRGDNEPFRGYRVDSVSRGWPAAAMGVEKGDIILFIGRNMAFTTREAYLYALRQQGRTTDIGLINIRNGKLTWRRCRLNHNAEPHQMEDPPPGVIMVDFARDMD